MEEQMNAATTAAKAAIEGKTAIPWQMILDMLMKFMEGCLNPPAPEASAIKAAAAAAGPFRHGQLRRAYSRLNPRAGFRECQHAAEAGLAAVGACDDAALTLLASNS